MANRCRFFYTVSEAAFFYVFCCIIPDLWCVFVNLDISLVTMSCCFVVMVKFFNRKVAGYSNNLPN